MVDPSLHPLLYPLLTSSSDESRASSALSVLSSAGALSGVMEPLDISGLGQALEALKGYYYLFVCFLSFTEWHVWISTLIDVYIYMYTYEIKERADFDL